jgi:hypothetical protein
MSGTRSRMPQSGAGTSRHPIVTATGHIEQLPDDHREWKK